MAIDTGSDPLERFRKYESLSPFELKDDLIKIAKDPGKRSRLSRRRTR